MNFISDDAANELRNSGQFDEEWYVQQYPDVKIVGIDPAKHYLWLGVRLGRKPSREITVAEVNLPAPLESEVGRRGLGGVRGKIRKFHRGAGARAGSKLLTPELRMKIADSALFDKGYYRTHYADRIEDQDDLIADYISSLRDDPERDPGPLFSTQFYLKTHTDVQVMHPFVHYLEYGMREGRTAFPAEKVNVYLSESSHIELNPFSDIIPSGIPINIFYWEEGNFFFTDVARFMEQLFIERGHAVALRTDAPGPDERSALDVVVAPHEYCEFGPGRDWTSERYSKAVYVNTEQWQTNWFALSLNYIMRTNAGVLDLNPSSAQGLARMGFKAAFLPLLPLTGSCFDFSPNVELSEHVMRLKFVDPLTYPDGLVERPYDVVCCAVLNQRRSEALASIAHVLADYRSFLHVPRFDRPIKASDPDVLSAEDVAQLTRNSKIMLNIHQGETHYLEWHRMFLLGMMQGSVVVSEPCYPNRYLQPDVHYIEASIERMGAVLTHLLSTEIGRRKMAEIHGNVIKLREAILAGERLIS